MDALLSHLRSWNPNGNGELKHEQLITVLKELDNVFWSDEKVKMLLESLPDPMSIEKFADSLYAQGIDPGGAAPAAGNGMTNEALVKACEARGIKVLYERAVIDVALCKKLTPEEREGIKTIFDTYDKDKSGSIDLKELTAMCKDLGRTVTEAQAKSAMEQLDKDGSGKCDFNEFLLYWTSKPKLGGYDEITLQLLKARLAAKAAAAKAKTLASQMKGKPVPEGKGALKANLVVSPNMGPFEPKMSAKISLTQVEEEGFRPTFSARFVATDEKGASAAADELQTMLKWMSEDEELGLPFVLAVEQTGNVFECKGSVKPDNEDFDDPMFAMMLGMVAQTYDWVDINLDWSNDISDLVGQPDKHLFEHIGGVRCSLDSQIQYGYVKTMQMMMMEEMEDTATMELWKSGAQAFNGTGLDVKLGYFPGHLKVVGSELKALGMEIPTLAKMQKMIAEDDPVADDEKVAERWTQIAKIVTALSDNVTNLESITIGGLGSVKAKIVFEKFRPWLLWQYLFQPVFDRIVEKKHVPAPIAGFSAVKDIGDKERERIKKTFDQYDKDGSGAIDLKELEGMVKELGGNITTEEAQEAIKQLDKDGSLTVNFNEFELWWSSKPGLGGYSSVALGFLRMKMNGWNAMMKAKKALINNTFGVTEDSESMLTTSYEMVPNMTPIEPKAFLEASVSQESASSSSGDAVLTLRLEATSTETAAKSLGAIKDKYAEFEPMMAEMPFSVAFEQDDVDVVVKVSVPAEVAEAMLASADPGMMSNLVTAIQSLLNTSARISFGHTFEDLLEAPDKPLVESLKGMKMEMKSGLTSAGRNLLSGISIPGFQNVFRPLVRTFAGLSIECVNGYKPESLGAYMSNVWSMFGLPGDYCLQSIKEMFQMMFPGELSGFVPLILDLCKSLKGPKSLTVSGFLPKPGADGAKLEGKILFERFSIFSLVAYFLEGLPVGEDMPAEVVGEPVVTTEEMTNEMTNEVP